MNLYVVIRTCAERELFFYFSLSRIRLSYVRIDRLQCGTVDVVDVNGINNTTSEGIDGNPANGRNFVFKFKC